MDLSRLRRSLLRWFSRSKRPLPWRSSRDPYAIWVSETMLQQTTVATVVPYYVRFMARFPTLTALAAADENSVLAVWSGLGYYSRARNLRLGAQLLIRQHGGRFPSELDAALTIKGVGRYTASAVTSIAYGTKAAAVDGNVRRVLSRLYAIRDPNPRQAQELASGLLSLRSPGAWNEAMMELGATICLPGKPRCQACPVRLDCRGRSRPEHWSVPRARKASVRTAMEMALVERRGRVLLVRNGDGGLMAGLYELPHAGLPRPGHPFRTLRDRYRAILEIDPRALAVIRHSVTHHRIEATIFRGKLLTRSGSVGSFYAPEKLPDLPLSGLTRKALRAVDLSE